MVEDDAFSHKRDYFTMFLEILNLEGHQNCIPGSRVTSIVLNGWTLPIGEAASGRVCTCSLCSRLDFLQADSISMKSIYPGYENKKCV